MSENAAVAGPVPPTPTGAGGNNDNGDKNIVRLHRETINQLDDGYATCRTILRTATTAAAKANASAELINIETKKQLIEAKYDAWLDNTATIDRPSDAQINDVIQRGKELAAITAQEARLNAVINIVNEAVNAFNSFLGK